MIPDCSEFCKWLYEWQTLIAGLIAGIGGLIATLSALTAGILAYCAAQRQARAAEAGTRHLQIEAEAAKTERKVAAAKLLDGILLRIERDVDKLYKDCSQEAFMSHDAVVPKDWKLLISKPSFPHIISLLLALDEDIITRFITLNADIDVFKSREIPSAAHHRDTLENIRPQISDLRLSLNKYGHIINTHKPSFKDSMRA